MHSQGYTLRMDPSFDWQRLAESPQVVRNRLGQTHSFIEDGDDPSDNSRQCSTFDWHCDGLYHETPPRYVMQYCLDPGEHGVTTGLCSVDEALGSLPATTREALALLTTAYFGHDGLRHYHPMLSADGLLLSSRGLVNQRIMTVSSYVNVRQATRAMSELFDALDAHKFSIHWEPGLLLVFDQRRYAHCRDSRVLSDPRRKLVRMWLERWDD